MRPAILDFWKIKINFGAKILQRLFTSRTWQCWKIQCALLRVSCKRTKTLLSWIVSVRLPGTSGIISVFNNCTFALSERVWWIFSSVWDKTHTIWKITYCWSANVLTPPQTLPSVISALGMFSKVWKFQPNNLSNKIECSRASPSKRGLVNGVKDVGRSLRVTDPSL